jgi:hypothetical protein
MTHQFLVIYSRLKTQISYTTPSSYIPPKQKIETSEKEFLMGLAASMSDMLSG